MEMGFPMSKHLQNILLELIGKPISIRSICSSENVLLIMLGDDNEAIRAKAANMISKIRRNNEREAHNHTSFESFIFLDAISMQSATLHSLTVMKKDEQLLPTFQTIKES